jgi:hypothetical protein
MVSSLAMHFLYSLRLPLLATLWITGMSRLLRLGKVLVLSSQAVGALEQSGRLSIPKDANMWVLY